MVKWDAKSGFAVVVTIFVVAGLWLSVGGGEAGVAAPAAPSQAGAADGRNDTAETVVLSAPSQAPPQAPPQAPSQPPPTAPPAPPDFPRFACAGMCGTGTPRVPPVADDAAERASLVTDPVPTTALPNATWAFLASGAAGGAGCDANATCVANGACSGSWRLVGGCPFAGLEADFYQRGPIAAANRFLFNRSNGTCPMHASVARHHAAFTSAAWLADAVAGRRFVFIGHSHQRNLFTTFAQMAVRAAPARYRVALDIRHTTLNTTWFEEARTLVETATGRVAAVYVVSPLPSFHDLDVAARYLKGGAPTDVVVGRGVWDVCYVGVHPEDMRVQLQFVLAEARRRFPAARLTLYPTHFVQRSALDASFRAKVKRCARLRAQLVYRDALYAAVRNLNGGLLRDAAFHGAAEGEAVPAAVFRRPIEVLDVFAMTATPEARALSDAGHNGHHYASPLRVSFVVQLLLGDNDVEAAAGRRAPLPLPPAPASDLLLSRAASGLLYHGERAPRAGEPAAMALYDAALLQPAFHRFRAAAAGLRRAVRGKCFTCLTREQACAVLGYREVLACNHPLGMVAALPGDVANGTQAIYAGVAEGTAQLNITDACLAMSMRARGH
jgi:hypothetical protein